MEFPIDMNASAEHIHNALEAVARIRDLRRGNARLFAANAAIKRFQAGRFQATYPDLLRSPRYQTAARFFLIELYGNKDYGERDQQFARIANTIATLFPQSVVNTAAALAEVHALTERLDDALARAYLELQPDVNSDHDQIASASYIACWRQVADAGARQHQLEVVLALGRSLDSLTRKPGLRMLLKMMRGPAAAAGLASLQRFLEAGFDAFQTMRGADEFLNLITLRETDWIQRLFNEDAVTCETKLTALVPGNGEI
jgi:hypothetical protein